MKEKTIVATICFTAVLITALILGYDNYLLFIGLSALASLSGFTLGKYTKS